MIDVMCAVKYNISKTINRQYGRKYMLESKHKDHLIIKI